MEEIKKIAASKTFKTALWTVLGLLVILGSFASGMQVGLRKARYSYQWGANYERNFMMPGRPEFGPRGMMGPGGPMGFFRDFEGRDFRNAHGLAGTIVSVTDNNIVIKDRDNKENTVAVNDKTVIKAGPNDIKIGDLKTDERIVVVGKPGDNGVINAEIIRVFDNNINVNPQN